MKKKMQVVHDTSAATPDRGRAYLHCQKCLEEWKALPDGARVTPKAWARQQVALTDGGIQVWCTRHDCNITLMTFKFPEQEADNGGKRRRGL